MSLKYRDADFWRKFHADHWKPGVPTVLRQPFVEPPFSESGLAHALGSFAKGLEEGDNRKTCLVSIGDAEQAPRQPLRRLFRNRPATLPELERSCARLFPEKRFGLMVTQMQAVDAGIWTSLTAFLQDASAWLDVPAPSAHLDLFYGNYRSQFTGLHKDTQDILAFVVRGKKRMLAWPFDYFVGRVDGVTPADRYFNKRLSVDYRKYRADAVVLDAEAGDVIYWPNDHWHVSEARGSRFSAMLSLGLVKPDIGGFGHSTERLVSREVPEASGEDVARQLRWRTSFGFELGGPLAESRPARRVEISIRKIEHCVICWKVDHRERRVLVASNGHSASLPLTPGLVDFLERLARGEVVTEGDSPDGTRSTISEQYWNNRCELKTRTRTTSGSVTRWLAHWFLRVHAVEAVPGSR